MFRKVRRYLQNPYYALGDDLLKTHPNWMSDKYFIKVFWKQMMDCPLNLEHPESFNEKIQWMKLYDRNPLYTMLVDKLKVKEWVAEKIGTEHVIPTLAVYDDVEDIKLEDLPDRFVLKCNHDSGGVVICKDKSKIDFGDAKMKLKKSFGHNFYWDYREWAYKDVERKIFAEQFLEDAAMDDDLPDYKVFVFGGVPKLIQVDFDRFKNHKRNLYDTDWNYVDARILYPNDPNRVFDRPKALDELLSLSAKLGENLPQVRTDFYLIGNKVYFGEMTFYHGGGYEKFEPKSLGLKMGEWINLPEKRC